MNKNNPYKNFWRGKKKLIDMIFIIGVILVGIILQLLIVNVPLSLQEELDSKDSYCLNNCKSACINKGNELMSYKTENTRCLCECSDKIKVIFGLDEFNYNN